MIWRARTLFLVSIEKLTWVFCSLLEHSTFLIQHFMTQNHFFTLIFFRHFWALCCPSFKFELLEEFLVFFRLSKICFLVCYEKQDCKQGDPLWIRRIVEYCWPDEMSRESSQAFQEGKKWEEGGRGGQGGETVKTEEKPPSPLLPYASHTSSSSLTHRNNQTHIQTRRDLCCK